MKYITENKQIQKYHLELLLEPIKNIFQVKKNYD